MADKLEAMSCLFRTSLLVFAALVCGPAYAEPSSLIASPVATSIASDSVTGINVVLKNADGKLYNGEPIEVRVSSGCANTGLSVLQPTAYSINGIASVSYRPEGCLGFDKVTAQIVGKPALTASFLIYITTARNLSAKGRVGRRMYFDSALSAAGNVSCATCHSPANNYYLPTASRVPLGGISGQVIGFRTAPTAAYASFIPPFNWQTNTAAGSIGSLGTPRAGLMWDGRSSTLSDQARGPFIEPHEMANAGNKSVLSKLLARPYVAEFSKAYGPVSASSNPDQVVANMADAIATFERQDPSFRLFNSKYDRVQVRLASLTQQEKNGEAIFFDPAKGGCAGCHNSVGAQQNTNQPQLFSDQSYRAIGVPRNWTLPYNDDSKSAESLSSLGLSILANGASAGTPNHVYYDLGVCGPFRKDSLLDPGLCGTFRVPTLRNVALKHSYFHNGIFGDLFQVINFYINREIKPSELYVNQSGQADVKYNDLPTRFQGNVQQRVPFRPLGSGAPRLTASEIQDLIAFLCTLTDGYDVNNSSAYSLPAQCQAAQR